MYLQKQTLCLALALSLLGVQASTVSHDNLQRAQPTRTFIPQWMADSKFSNGMLHQRSVVPAPLLTSYGQSNEDLFAEAHFFHNLHNGTFLELGALDGNLYSNTKFFEDQRGWRGVLVEPNREEFEKIPFYRPEAIAVHAAICAQSRNVHFVSRRTHKRTTESAGGLGGIWEFMAESFQRRWYGTDIMPEDAEVVPCVSLGSILRSFGLSRVDFFSLDVEGAELEVLRTLDLSALQFNVIAIEQDGQNPTKDEAVRDYLLADNYELYVGDPTSDPYALAGSRNDWFINKHFRPSEASA